MYLLLRRGLRGGISRTHAGLHTAKCDRMYYNILVLLAYCIPSHLISDQSGHLVPDWFRESVLHVNHMFVNATDVNGDVGGREQRGKGCSSMYGGFRPFSLDWQHYGLGETWNMEIRLQSIYLMLSLSLLTADTRVQGSLSGSLLMVVFYNTNASCNVFCFFIVLDCTNFVFVHMTLTPIFYS